jgi:hypothetical protein
MLIFKSQSLYSTNKLKYPKKHINPYKINIYQKNDI